jgi:trk/ktr system potassium uptake protein
VFEPMKALVVGCGRVGSALAKRLQEAGWDVAALDESEEALGRLGENWPGAFHVGHALDLQALEAAGIRDADALIASTDGDNTNIVVAQVAKLRYEVPHVAARILDPARAEVYTGRGFDVVSPTGTAIEALTESALGSART